jgi:peptidoglycan/LPS O-acetylase OafA/YrhL
LQTVSNSTSLNFSGRILELDGLRGIAIGMVLVYHYFDLTLQATPGTVLAQVITSGQLSWSGVDLFFVLSGFLIGGILLEARASTNYFQVLYTRRVFRIVPIYAVLLLCFPVPLYGARLIDLTWLIKNPMPWYSYWTFTQNFWMAITGVLAAGALEVTWSLAIELSPTAPELVRS